MLKGVVFLTDAKIEKQPVDYSAGLIILCLIPGNEEVALVLNKRSMEIQVVPLEFLKKRRYRDALVEERENDAIISFIQPDGFGSPFGKEEPEDDKDRKVTAAREGEEETGAPVWDRLIADVSYTEKPNHWSTYSNTVFLADGRGFKFDKANMRDPFVDPAWSDMWKLRQLPIPRRRHNDRDEQHKERYSKRRMPEPVEKGIGIYQAALRRIIAILLQLNSDHLARLGRPNDKDAEDLVWMVVKQIPYRNFFSHRMLKMLSGLNRMDVAMDRLERDFDKERGRGILYHPELTAAIGANMILWLPYKPEDPWSMLNRTLQLIHERCHVSIQSGIDAFLVDRLERREKAYLVSADKDTGLGDSDEKSVVIAEEDDPIEDTKE